MKLKLWALVIVSAAATPTHAATYSVSQDFAAIDRSSARRHAEASARLKAPPSLTMVNLPSDLAEHSVRRLGAGAATVGNLGAGLAGDIGTLSMLSVDTDAPTKSQPGTFQAAPPLPGRGSGGVPGGDGTNGLAQQRERAAAESRPSVWAMLAAGLVVAGLITVRRRID